MDRLNDWSFNVAVISALCLYDGLMVQAILKSPSTDAYQPSNHQTIV